MDQNSSRRLYRFGVFEADEETGELRKQGRRLALQGQPLQVLLMLLNRAGDLVTRAELQQRIWTEGTFVDFEHGINSAINKIRDTLDDSATNPRFIETLAKRGYRFVAPVHIQDGAELERTQQTGVAEPDASKMPPVRRTRRLLTSADEVPRVRHGIPRILFFLLQVMYLCFYVGALARLRDAQEVLSRFVPGHFWIIALLIVTAAIGIPTRSYLLTGIAFRSPKLRSNFLRLFPIIFPLDELWALSPFLLIDQIGFGLALGATAALLYVPFAQRSLILMDSASLGAPPNASA
ncbi:MAG TPA: winged helix-turn-helix domain-containing protein [Candidatus Acidoferrales bacterium]|nr:winged helix-turn-helix domain-containing protein [Candidatus Acidoferrales bacterium]